MKKLIIALLALLLTFMFSSITIAEENIEKNTIQNAVHGPQIPPEKVQAFREKFMELMDELKEKPGQDYVETLDGQKVDLRPFGIYSQYDWQICIPEKFYHWKSDVIETTSKCESGQLVLHKVKRYWAPRTIASDYAEIHGYGSQKDLHSGFGDFAEVYESGTNKFMGFLLYVGNGEYFIMPDFKYQAEREQGFGEEKRGAVIPL
ncbi:hypothetical protein A2331_04100 [Candidatus Falkowbacteria bacterium RIFOXYB2_FULL_34_18]|uniref:Uncharacterized protein n=1 Tax=Candidatus Falkowbacteria bacterium RIFOXYD2_FULL_34_120 TaxID=1798007 RepID=A0A1F5TSD7_9BACT|nr:MAG: hypothetical protein A2331_04100 [Candidatus Falkowbacteria bacterium RIFOXYB2_FULL_34_18]OGF29725.1 MAG: hypothetical protein A2500_00425 [Candidatus Falkowbacteria bacterium RIFOXYC12_FULL_34_55]OGF37410.1 MAG: hypothetical protein A2466_00295 [Candidatus Falkowbacteria bacterium RIFOXYC2_FULL_34_220]OGF39135.1 MAG: hypothetical protein A2515_00250 [Candidatus Falkowbacteria bacterium RIFOXYD12_FULL_34_57]OGF41684.1 MAG: hypothetical protein A2531_05970 [Candidatus Falkowbacteria bact